MKEKVFDGDFFKKLERISIKTVMSMTQGAAGGRKSKVKGNSVEFSDFREYTPGDDFRRIDWNAYGRFDKLFVKLFMEEREATINIFLDCSKSMDFDKGIMALRLSGVFTYLALNNLDRVYINKLQDKGIAVSPSFMGKSAFQNSLNFMENSEFKGNTLLSETIKMKDLKNRGISIVMSDFFTLGKIEDIVKYLAYKKQHIILIQILTQEELEPNLDGQVSLVDSETGERVNLIITPKLLKQYNAKLKAMSLYMKEAVKKYGGSFVQVSTSEPLDKVIFEQFAREGII